MSEKRSVIRRIRDKVAGRLTHSSSPTTSDTADLTTHNRPILPAPNPSTPVFSSTPSPFPITNLPDHRTTSFPNSSIVGEYVTVVGHDQINITNNFINPEEQYLLNKLSHVAESSFDASTPALRRACTENTRTAILEAIEEWAFDSTKPRIYWMNGMAGTGKTTISYSVSLRFKQLNILGATFFCSRLVDECTKVDRIFPTLAYNLSQNHPPFSSVILEALKNDPDIAKRTINQQFTNLLVKPFREATNLSINSTVVVIDALDECVNQTDVQTFLSVMFQRSSELPFKIFITSRPEQLLRVGFNRQHPDTYSRFILHDIERDLVNADIKLYMIERLVEMVDGRSDFQESMDDWPPEDKIDILTCRADRLFIFAKTVCDYIGGQGGNILERLNSAALSREESNELPGDTLNTSELDRLYRDIMDRATPNQQNERDRLTLVLSSVISIRNPLSARGLGALLGVDPGVIKSALGSLHAVISVPRSLDAPVSTFHTSFPDFLTEPTRSLRHFLLPSRSHQQLAKSCLFLMNSSLKENLCGLQGRPSNDEVTIDVIRTHIPEGLAYACVYWASHLTAVRKEDVRNTDDLREQLNVFLREHVLHWIECLSLLGRLNIAVDSLRTIEGWVLDIYPETQPMITDARRFVVENFEVICGYCLETYHSALVWLPVQSIIRKHYATQKLELPKVLVGLRKTWGSCEKVIFCGSAVHSVAFSSDGGNIVSGSEDGAVRIWNAVTGKVEVVLRGHSAPVLSVAFSSDGSRVVSGSEDMTIRIWNVMTGEPECIFEGHSGPVSSVALSSDGSHVVSGSVDSTVRMWNAATGGSEGVFKGHSDRVSSVTFSSDGSHVVSGSVDSAFRVWDAVTGESEGVFKRHSGWVSSVALSSDGSRVASGSYDETIQIWNAETGETEGILDGHSGPVFSVAFSSDGSRVASGSYDETVRIWNTSTGESEVVFNGHSGWVSSVALSSDGTHVASGSYDKTIRIWNVMMGESEDVFEGHSDGVLSMNFLSDGRLVVSGSYDETIRIWNAVTGEAEGVLEGHLGPVFSVAFSSGGSHVVSGSGDKTVRIWDAVTGEAEGVLEGHSDRVSSVAFSSDGSHVVSGSNDKTVRIWNAVTGESEGVLMGHLGWVSSVAFSSGGSHIISGSVDKTIRVWNAMTGGLEGVFEGYSSWVSSVASPSSTSHVVYGSHGQTATGELDCVVEEHSDGGSKSVRLSDQANIQYQPGGRFIISTAPCDHGGFRHTSFLSVDKAWIRTDSVPRGCWIPERYRDFSRSCSCGLKLCFGFRSGRVVVLDLG